MLACLSKARMWSVAVFRLPPWPGRQTRTLEMRQEVLKMFSSPLITPMSVGGRGSGLHRYEGLENMIIVGGSFGNDP